MIQSSTLGLPNPYFQILFSASTHGFRTIPKTWQGRNNFAHQRLDVDGVNGLASGFAVAQQAETSPMLQPTAYKTLDHRDFSRTSAMRTLRSRLVLFRFVGWSFAICLQK